MISQEQIDQYNENGFLNVTGLFSAEEVAFFRSHFEAMRLAEHPELAQSLNDTAIGPTDPLKSYPRVMMPHRRDEASLRWLIDERLNRCMTALLGAQPYAVQTMFY